MKLQDYCGAKEVLEKGASLVQNDPRFTKMINECALLAGGIYFPLWLFYIHL